MCFNFPVAHGGQAGEVHFSTCKLLRLGRQESGVQPRRASVGVGPGTKLERTDERASERTDGPT